MSTVTLEINEKTVTGRTGMTILDLARDSGIPIPTLCHDPALTDIGACRICLVEETNRGILLPACVTQIAQGMVIKTDSFRVIENRRAIVHLLMANHPESCIVCDKGNRCRLRALAAEMGIGAIPLDPMPLYFPTFDVNPFFKRDMGKCILCGKCIRGDQELVVEGVLDYVNRGFDSRPATFQNAPLEQAGCTFCGTCLSLCPTGALSETQLGHQGSLSQEVTTVCSHCACGCGLTVEVESDRVIRVTPVKDPQRGPVLCVKGHFGFNYVHSPDRLQTPLIRKEGSLVEATWEEALAKIKEGFEQLTEKGGSEVLGCLASPHLTNEELYLFQKLARIGFQTPHIDNGSRLSMAPVLTVQHQVWGQVGATAPLEKLARAELIWVMGANPNETAPVMGYFIKRAVLQKKAQLVVVDPRKTKLALNARLWLRPQPGSDLSLITLMIHHLLTENRLNQAYIYSQTDGFLEWKESFLKQDFKAMRETVDYSPDDIHQAVELFVKAKGVALVLGSGITQQLQATALVMGLHNLMLLTGQWGQPESGFYPVLKESNAQGAWDMGVVPDLLPGYLSLTDNGALTKIESRWGKAVPKGPGLTALEMIAAAQQGTLKGLYLASEDPLGTYPDRQWVKEALEKLEFLVVQDLFLTDTALMAQVVLPTVSFFEKEGTATNLERRVLALNQGLPTQGRAKTDGDIFSLLLHSFCGTAARFSPQDILEEIRELVPGYGSVTADRLSKGPVFLPAFNQSGKSISFLMPKIQLDRMARESQYPFLMISGSLLFHLGGGNRTWKDWRLKSITPQAQVVICPEDARTIGIEPGNNVEIRTPRGSLIVAARVGDEVSPGVVFLPLPYPELKINQVFENFWDPSSKGSLHKICPVQIIKIGAKE